MSLAFDASFYFSDQKFSEALWLCEFMSVAPVATKNRAKTHSPDTVQTNTWGHVGLRGSTAFAGSIQTWVACAAVEETTG